ncbi:MAG: serine/threonine protein kinase, partial [Planctomycetota bacterium]
KSVDHRADIYSLGCTLFHLLTSRPPYSGATILKRIRAHRTKPIPSLCEARNDVPECLDAVYRRMLAKNPDDRQESMREVIADLEACGNLPTEWPAKTKAAERQTPPPVGEDDPSGPADSDSQP